MTFPQDHRGEVQKAPGLKRFLPGRSCCGARIAAGPLSLLEDGEQQSSCAMPGFLAHSLYIFRRCVQVLVLWPSFKKLPVTGQHYIGFSCLTRGGVSMDKGYILVSRYFCDVNETPCSG